MKQSSPMFKILSMAVLSGVLLFFGVQMYQYFSDPLTITPVYVASTEETISADGWVVRDEEVFHAEGTLVHYFSEGEKVGVGQILATAYSSAGALETVRELESCQLRLEQLEFALSSYLDPDAALKLDGDITESLLILRGDLAEGDYTTASENLSRLKSNILKRSHSYSSAPEIQAEISAVQSEMSSLRASLSGATNLWAQRGGTYSAVCDGYETVLTPDMLTSLTPAMLSSVKAQSEPADVGKLIYGDTWYYAVNLAEKDVAILTEGSQATLRLSKGLEKEITVNIHSVSAVENGKQTVVFSCNKYLAQVTQLRRQAADLVLEQFTGLHIPANALRMDDQGRTGVYCLVGFVAEFKPVDVVYQGDGYTLVRAAASASGGRILRAGDEVIVTTAELYDGKVVR